MASALIASMSMGEKIAGGGAIAAVIGFFLPWFSAANQGSASGLDLGKSVGAVYLILLIAVAAAALCYLSSKAPASRKLMYAGYLVLIGALCGPGNLLALLFVSKLQAVAGIGLWLLSLGYTAIAAGGLMTIRGFSSRTY
jgi:lipoprotein signal peptidase